MSIPIRLIRGEPRRGRDENGLCAGYCPESDGTGRGKIAMIVRTTGVGLDELAHRSFDFFTRLSLTLPLGRRRHADDLKELEFLTLAILRQHRTMIVGDIQRILGILPAQMSRIIRSLEDHESPLIGCQINPHDKRKVDVHLTDAGEQALADYIAPRVTALAELLAKLTADEREALADLLDKLQPPPPDRSVVS
jgi:DNA-binding MarR family transcriptional regulator